MDTAKPSPADGNADRWSREPVHPVARRQERSTLSLLRLGKLPRVFAAFGHFCLRRGADLPQVDRRAETPGALIGQPPRRRRDRPAAGRLCTDEPRKTRRGCSAMRRKSMAVGCACIGSLRTKLKLGSRGSQERDGKTPCRAMHWVSVASVAVKIGFAVGRAKVLLPSPPYLSQALQKAPGSERSQVVVR